MGKFLYWLVLYLVFCIIGAGLEWCYGAFWDTVGTAPWIYTDSPLHYTSLEGLPLWGFGGLVCVSVYRATTNRRAKLLLGTIVSVILAMLWIVFYSNVLE